MQHCAVWSAGDLQSRIYSLSAQLAQTRQDRDQMASALDAAGISKNPAHAATNSKPSWDNRTKHPDLRPQQSVSPSHESFTAGHGRSALQHHISRQMSHQPGHAHQHQAAAISPERSHASFAVAQRSHSVAGSRVPGNHGGLQQPQLRPQPSAVALQSAISRTEGSISNGVSDAASKSRVANRQSSFSHLPHKPPLNHHVGRQGSSAQANQHHMPAPQSRSGQQQGRSSIRYASSQHSSPTMLQLLKSPGDPAPLLQPSTDLQNDGTNQQVSRF